MKKAGIILPAVLIILAILACTLPSSVDVKWSPDITIPYKSKDFSSEFGIGPENFSSDDDEMKIRLCDGTEVMTMALYKEILNQELDLKDILSEEVNLSGDYSLDKVDDIPDYIWNQLPSLGERKLLYGTDQAGVEAPSIPLGDIVKILDGELNGFKFKDIPAKIYVGGENSIMESLEINIKYDSNDITFGYTGLSDFNTPKGEPCHWVDLPVNGKNLPGLKDIINDGQENLKIMYNVYLKKDEHLKKEWFRNTQNVKAEMVALLPLDLVADPDDAELKFPDSFGKDDLFGRKTDATATDIIEYLELGIELENNPFRGAELIIKSDKGNIVIRNPNVSSTISFVFNEDTMKKINDPANIPFAPKISFHFNKGGELIIPREFKTKKLNFKAKILYNVDLGGK